MIACADTIARQEERKLRENLIGLCHEVSAAVYALRLTQQMRPDLIELMRGDVEYMHDALTVIKNEMGWERCNPTKSMN